jgi:hypothetical protein
MILENLIVDLVYFDSFHAARIFVFFLFFKIIRFALAVYETSQSLINLCKVLLKIK